MSDEKDLDDLDPFGEEGEAADENLITEAMVKKATYHIHKLAEQKKKDFKEIQKKCKALFAYTNLAKVTLEDGHKIIDKLIELTGGEEEQSTAPQLPTKPDEGLQKREIKKEIVKKEEEETKTDEDVPVAGDDEVTFTMRRAVRAAVDITLKEVVEKDVPVQGLGGFVLEISKVIFEAKMAEEAEP
jgi:type IV secretory pathway VirD2 relaxase